MKWFTSTIQTIALGIILIPLGFLFHGCLFDPWPEPGEAQDENGAEWDTEGDGDTELFDMDALVDLDRIYSSAPNKEGLATVVGVPGAVGEMETKVRIENEQGATIEVAVHETGSFAGRIQATEEETLLIFPSRLEMSESVEVTVGSALNYLNDNVVGPLDVPAPSSAGLVYLHSEYELTMSGVTVVAGNITHSAGSKAETDCSWGECLADIYIPAASGDELDLFFVADGENTGNMVVQTVIIPDP